MTSSSFAITGATLIDGTGRPPIVDAVVIVDADAGRIIRVGRRSDTPLADDLPRLEAVGKTLLPGLIDAHAHVGPVVAGADLEVGNDRERIADEFMSWFPNYGITAVRCTGMPNTDDTFRHLKRGKPQWPRFVGSGQNLDGVPGGPWPGLIVLRNENEARAHTNTLADKGADFVKTYVFMTPDLQHAVVDTAHRRGLLVATHAGHLMTVEEAVLCGVDALEHVRVGRELVPEESLGELKSLPVRKHDYLMDFRAWRYIDPESEAADRLIDLLVERGITLTPTLVFAKWLLLSASSGEREPPGMSDLPVPLQDYWRSSDLADDHTAEDHEFGRVEFERQLHWVGRAHEAGVHVCAGTDTPSEYMVPGTTLHDELALLVECGLSPLEAIVTATGAASELMERQTEFGTVSQGKYADLLLLDANPLDDIRNTRSIAALWKEGQLISGNGSQLASGAARGAAGLSSHGS